MSNRKAAKAKATRASKARVVQAARTQALGAKVLVSEAAPANGRLRRVFSIRMAREFVLTAGAIAGTVCILLAIAAFAFDVQPVVFRSGSMSPAIDTGALAISKSVGANDLAVGDIVTVKTSKGVRVTHRIQSLTRNAGEATLILRGDANTVSDDQPYVVRSASRVLFDIPKAGYVVSWVSGSAGVFVGGFLVGLLVLIAFAPGSRTNSGGARKSSATFAMLALGVCATGTAGNLQTEAFFTDAATMTTGTFTSGTLPTPGSFTCVPGNGNTLDFSWTWPAATPNPTSFIIQFTGGPVSITKTGNLRVASSGNINNQSGTVSIVATKNYGSTIWTSVPSATHSYSFVGSTKSCT